MEQQDLSKTKSENPIRFNLKQSVNIKLIKNRKIEDRLEINDDSVLFNKDIVLVNDDINLMNDNNKEYPSES